MKPQEIEAYLVDNDLYTDAVYEIDDTVKIEIQWGDWKHEHGRCRHLMAQIGYTQENQEVIDDDGSDCYSAIHTYVKSEI